ncbi:MAG: sigma-70 family RNA polymerase sigma factor [Pirellulaceae bacterium]|jgi:RNA polymerase sigma-70 factor (ECF subfamily)|nr:sigma-70 family RNA polymerase sigma factor [Pirellulaceae bacterium]
MTTFVDSTSSGLIDGAKRQDPRAWRRLVQLYGGLVYSWCRKFGVSQADAADVFQEVFRSVHTHITDFRRDDPGHAFRGWLWTVTRNKIRDHFRRLAGRPQATGGTDAMLKLLNLAEENSSMLGDQSSSQQQSSSLLAGMEMVQAEFEDGTWQAFWRTTVDDVPTSVVADELEMSVNAVRLAKSRVLRRLREQLDAL